MERSVIYIWDHKKKTVIWRLGCKNSNLVLENFTFVIETHPKYENFFMSGGGAGKVILWNIETGTSISTFTETGVYHRDPNILNEVFDGKFSS